MTANQSITGDASNAADVARAITLLGARIDAQDLLLLALFTSLGQAKGPFFTRAEAGHVLEVFQGVTDPLPEPVRTACAELVRTLLRAFHGLYGQPSREHLRLVRTDASEEPRR